MYSAPFCSTTDTFVHTDHRRQPRFPVYQADYASNRPKLLQFQPVACKGPIYCRVWLTCGFPGLKNHLVLTLFSCYAPILFSCHLNSCFFLSLRHRSLTSVCSTILRTTFKKYSDDSISKGRIGQRLRLLYDDCFRSFKLQGLLRARQWVGNFLL